MKRTENELQSGFAPVFLFGSFVILSLTTPSWRYGSYSWIPLISFDHLAGGPVKFGILNLVPLLFVASWAAKQYRSGSWTWGPLPITIPLALFSLWALFRLDGAPFRLQFIFGGDFVLVWITYLYVINQRPPLRPILAIVVVIQSIVGSLQFFTQGDLGLVALGELPLNPAFEGVTVLQARGAAWLRAYGLTAHPNLFGALLALCLLLIVARTKRLRSLVSYLLPVIILGIVGLFFSFSRTAWLGAGLGFAIWLAPQAHRLKTLRQWRWWLLVPLLLLGLILFAYGDLVMSRLVNLDEPLEARSINQRLEDARLALQLARENPLMGVGLGYNVDAASQIDEHAARVHNVLLLALAELGIPGLVLILLLLLSPLFAFVPLLRRREYQRAATGLAPWVAVIVVNQFDTTLWLNGNWQTAILFALAASHAVSYLQPEPRALAQPVEPTEVVHSA